MVAEKQAPHSSSPSTRGLLFDWRRDAEHMLRRIAGNLQKGLIRCAPTKMRCSSPRRMNSTAHRRCLAENLDSPATLPRPAVSVCELDHVGGQVRLPRLYGLSRLVTRAASRFDVALV